METEYETETVTLTEAEAEALDKARKALADLADATETPATFDLAAGAWHDLARRFGYPETEALAAAEALVEAAEQSEISAAAAAIRADRLAPPGNGPPRGRPAASGRGRRGRRPDRRPRPDPTAPPGGPGTFQRPLAVTLTARADRPAETDRREGRNMTDLLNTAETEAQAQDHPEAPQDEGARIGAATRRKAAREGAAAEAALTESQETGRPVTWTRKAAGSGRPIVERIDAGAYTAETWPTLTTRAAGKAAGRAAEGRLVRGGRRVGKVTLSRWEREALAAELCILALENGPPEADPPTRPEATWPRPWATGSPRPRT